MDVTSATSQPIPAPGAGPLEALDELRRERREADAARQPTVPSREPAEPLRLTDLPVPEPDVSDLAREMAKHPNVEIDRSDDDGGLKFSLTDADLLTRFSIDKDINRVVITMYQRETGEVVREFPPRDVLNVLAAIAGRGFTLDVSS